MQLSKMTMPSTIATFVNVGVFLEKARGAGVAINSPNNLPRKRILHPYTFACHNRLGARVRVGFCFRIRFTVIFWDMLVLGLAFNLGLASGVGLVLVFGLGLRLFVGVC